MNQLVIIIAKVSSYFIKKFNLGSGSTWPGHIALKLNPHFIKDCLKNSSLKVILIAGTNGKTTTSTLIKYFLEKNGQKVIQNEEGANLLNGIASSLLRHTTSSGKLLYDYAIFEVDENTLTYAINEITPVAVIILNLFRDQLDRYGEVNTIATKWHEGFQKLPESVHLLLNGDDPQIYYLGTDVKASVMYFGLSEELMEHKEIPHDVDSIYCPQCGEKLRYKKMSYSHLGEFYCTKCGFKSADVTTFKKAELESSLRGIYNFYNITAAILASQIALSIPTQALTQLLTTFKPAFGRQELIQYKNRTVFLLLSKNPTGFNQSIQAIKEISVSEKNTIMLLLNDRIPDGQDISWIWDVEFQNVLPLTSNLFISGDRAFDMALRLKYCYEENEKITSHDETVSFNNVHVIEDIGEAIERAIEKTEKGKVLIVLATYSAMLETREILLGRKLM